MELAYGLVLVGVILLYLQVILGRVCRWSTNWFVRKGAEAAYKLSNLAGTVALGCMPQEHSAAVWILHLVVLNNSLTAYDQENGLQYLLTATNILLFTYRAVGAVGRAGLSGAARFGSYVLVVAAVLVPGCCKIGIALASASQRDSEAIKEYMERQNADRGPNQYYNASTLEGYRYAVTLDPLTTVEEIYRQDEAAGGGGGGAEVEAVERRKGLCLSFALFRLLFRRYHGLPCHEATLPETGELVLEGLLGPHELPEHRRGFRVAEVELGFLHDHVHGGHVLWSRRHRVCYYTLAALKATLVYAASPAFYLAMAPPAPPATAFDPFVALLLLHLFLDLLQLVLYYRSDRWMVSYECRRLHADGRSQNRLGRMIACLRRMNACLHKYRLVRWNVYWQDRVGQYNLLQATKRPPTVWGASAITALLGQQSWDDSHAARQSAPATLPDHLLSGIARVLRDTGGTLGGVPTLERAHGLPRGEVRCGDDTRKVGAILKWHIATCYCEMRLRQDNSDPSVGSPCYEAATVMSRYCAYLVAFRPELLPASEGYTKEAFGRVLDEVLSLVGDHLPKEDRLPTLERRRLRRVEVVEKTVTLSDGLDLGHLLVAEITERNELWEILENIWAKLILSVAPQESLDATIAKRHTKYLAQGGEFVTHLWALLSHAGILKQTDWRREQICAENQGFMDHLQYYSDRRRP